MLEEMGTRPREKTVWAEMAILQHQAFLATPDGQGSMLRATDNVQIL